MRAENRPRLREVLNATGVPLHTNLGRACLSESAAQAAWDAARRYSTLEYDLDTGGRGSRHSRVEALLRTITGARECSGGEQQPLQCYWLSVPSATAAR